VINRQTAFLAININPAPVSPAVTPLRMRRQVRQSGDSTGDETTAKAKFHYASWFEPVCDQLRTS